MLTRWLCRSGKRRDDWASRRRFTKAPREAAISLFVDTSAWYAAADAGDRSHVRAKSILSQRESLITTDHVLIETWTLLRYRLHRGAAHKFWGAIRAGVAAIEAVGSADLEAAWTIHERFSDQDFSIVDQTIFAVMLRLGVHRVATFDDDFAVFRFGQDRNRAFEVVR